MMHGGAALVMLSRSSVASRSLHALDFRVAVASERPTTCTPARNAQIMRLVLRASMF